MIAFKFQDILINLRSFLITVSIETFSLIIIYIEMKNLKKNYLKILKKKKGDLVVNKKIS